MSEFKGLPTHADLKEAFSGESMTVHRYLYFATIADIEGFPDVAQLFRDLAEGGLHSTHGNLDYLGQVGDPSTDLPIGETDRNLAAALTAETYAYTELYPAMAARARADGFPDIASWFETLTKHKRAHVKQLGKALELVGTMMQGDRSGE